MDIETVRAYALSFPAVTEDMPFDDNVVVFRLENKIFGCVMLSCPDILTLKCDAAYAQELREEHPEIEGAFHWNKKYWNQLWLCGDLEDDLIYALIRHAYAQIVAKLPKRIKMEHPEYLEIH